MGSQVDYCVRSTNLSTIVVKSATYVPAAGQVHKYLVAIDGTSMSDFCLKSACELARPTDEIILLHVINPLAPLPPQKVHTSLKRNVRARLIEAMAVSAFKLTLRPPSAPEHEDSAQSNKPLTSKRHAHHMMEKYQQQCTDNGLQSSIMLLPHKPGVRIAQRLLEAVEQTNATVLVVGVDGMTTFMHQHTVTVGSIAELAAKKCKCSVVVVKGKYDIRETTKNYHSRPHADHAAFGLTEEETAMWLQVQQERAEHEEAVAAAAVPSAEDDGAGSEGSAYEDDGSDVQAEPSAAEVADAADA